MKKRELEDWEMAECVALKKAIDAFNAGKPRSARISQGQLADALSINQGSVSSYLNGVNALNAKVAAVIAGKIGVPVESFSPRLAKEIAQMAQAAGPASVSFQALEGNGSYSERPKGVVQALTIFDKVTPRSRAIISRIAQLEAEGKLPEEDLKIIEQLIERFSAAK